LSVPIMLDSEVVGTLSADIAKRDARPLEQHARVLEIVSNLIALDLNARRSAALECRTLEVENERLRSALRELENGIEHAVLATNEGVIHGDDLPPTIQMPDRHEHTHCTSLTSRVELLEKAMIVDALKSTCGNVAAAARLLKITPRIIRYKMKKLEIESRRVGERPK
jgi:transcriptional regulator with GAF, ATPase, and Fis domain